MKKNLFGFNGYPIPISKKILLFMKLTFLLFTLGIVNCLASVYSQKVTLDLKDARFSEVMQEISLQTNLDFAYSKEFVDMERLVSISVTNTDLKTVLDKLLNGTQLLHIELNGKIYLGPKILGALIENTILKQQGKVTGTIKDASNQDPIIGANITIEGTTIGTISDINGSFSLDVPSENSVLVISFIGYNTEKVSLEGKTTLNISLIPDITKLEEIVVVGYGTQAKKDILGSVSIVDIKSMKSLPVSSAELALQGQASGVNIISSGVPGGASNIFIRGISSFGNTEPLVVVDGVQSSLRDINANDIESVQVLKDAGAASIYGVRGSNGVILVTTKKGKKGAPTVTYSGYYGIQTPAKGNVFDLMSPSEYAVLEKRFNPNTELYPNGTVPDYFYKGYWNGTLISGVAQEGDPEVDPARYYHNPADPSKDYIIQKANKNGTDWFHEVFKNAPMQSHSVTTSGGNDASNYLFSVGYLNQQGTLIETSLERYSLRINSEHRLGKHIRIGENVYGFYKNNPTIDNQHQDNVISATYRSMNVIPVYDIMGNYGGSYGGPSGLDGANPVAARKSTRLNKSNAWDVVGNVYGEVDFLKYLTLRTSIGGTLHNYYGLGFSPNSYWDTKSHLNSNSLSENSGYSLSWTWTNTLTYSQKINKHNVKVLLGSEAISNNGRGLTGSATDFLLDQTDFLILPNGTKNIRNSSGAYIDKIYSLFGRMDYSFDDQYLLGATIRRDGSSKFGSKNRYGVFPSISAGWRISKANFMKDLSWIDDLKLRGSWGKMGSQNNVGADNAHTLFNSENGRSYYDIDGTNNSVVRGFYVSAFGNAITGWEEDIVTNIALDLTMLQNRLSFSLERYKKSIEGLLFPQPMPATAGGANAPIVNIGNVENKGWDFTATYHGNITDDFRYDVSLNFTTYKSNIKKLPDPYYFDAGGSSFGAIVRNQEEHPISSFFGYKITGLFQDTIEVQNSPVQNAAAPGRFKYADVDGNDTINEKDRTFIGNPNPDFTYGLNLGITYKNIDFSMIFYGSRGNDVFNYTRYFTDFWGNETRGKSRRMFNGWTPENPDTNIPIVEKDANFSNSGAVNSYYIEDGSFLKCRSITLGYTLPFKVLTKVGINKMRTYIQAANLFTITNYSGIDPELMSRDNGSSAAFGIDYGNYPGNQKSFVFGVELTF